MMKALVTDFSRVLLFPVDESYTKGLNALHKKLAESGDYDLWQYFRLNRDLLGFYKKLGAQMDVYVFTTEYIQEHSTLQPEIERAFKAIFSGARLGLSKTNSESYKSVAEKIGLEPHEILYIDDKEENLSAAREAGMAIILYKSNQQVMEEISQVLSQ